MDPWSSRGRCALLRRTAGSWPCPLARTANRRKSLSCADVAGPPQSRFVTELTNGTASLTPPLRPPLPRFEHSVLCCHRPGGVTPGEPPLTPTPCTPPPCPRPRTDERNGAGRKGPDGCGGGVLGEVQGQAKE